MTDHIQHLTVFLDEPIRVDDLEQIETALRMVKRVSRVERGTPTNFEYYQYASSYGIKLYMELIELLGTKLLDRKPKS